MKLKNIFNGFFKNKNEKIESNDSYCHTNIIWNCPDNLIILLSFTENHFGDIIELQDAIKLCNNLNSKIVYSSYDEEIERVDKDGSTKTELLIHKKYYLLIGGEPSRWENLYENIHNLGNNVLAKITNEITNNCNPADFKHLINDGVLNEFNNAQNNIDTPVKLDNGWEYTDPVVLLSRLPNGFTGRDIIKFIKIINKKGVVQIYDAYNKIRQIGFMHNDQFEKNHLYPLYAALFKNPTVEKLNLLLEPLYKQPDDDSIPGDISDESLDEIFREHYERFSAVADDSTQYEDIDEELADEEE